MAIPSNLPIVLGILAIFTTSCLIAIYAILATEHMSPALPLTRTIAIMSAAVEGVVLIFLSAHLFHLLRRNRVSASPSRLEKQPAALLLGSLRQRLWLVLSIVLSSAAAAISAAALISLGISIHSQADIRINSSALPYLAGVAVTLFFTFAAQLLFLAIHFFTARAISTNGEQVLLETGHIGGDHDMTNNCNSSRADTYTRSPSSMSRIKSIRYSQTSSPASSRIEKKAAAAFTPPLCQSTPINANSPIRSNTVAFFHASFARIARRFRLSTRPVLSSPSIDGFDSWDTWTVDSRCRRTELGTSFTPPTKMSRFVEAIPASPMTQQTPNLERAQSSREQASTTCLASSFTQGPTTRPCSPPQSHSPALAEAHIHPLFRSHSSTPPPVVSAGTVVTAALSTSTLMTVSDAQSLRASSRLRSGSLPAVSNQPGWQRSADVDVFRDADNSERLHTVCGSPELREDAGDATNKSSTQEEEDETGCRPRTDSSAERKMTPPVPEWILDAGSRAGLSSYASRRANA
ncbi:hypothetical protein SEPCBS119000_000473 [Sporothrix epigloea]|uniref:Uncharacterized protein n=1 Tax=Sporothrix epigloea TaxID=1892477 RepID=A0ABP0D6Z6_9PEZI